MRAAWQKHWTSATIQQLHLQLPAVTAQTICILTVATFVQALQSTLHRDYDHTQVKGTPWGAELVKQHVIMILWCARVLAGLELRMGHVTGMLARQAAKAVCARG